MPGCCPRSGSGSRSVTWHSRRVTSACAKGSARGLTAEKQRRRGNRRVFREASGRVFVPRVSIAELSESTEALLLSARDEWQASSMYQARRRCASVSSGPSAIEAQERIRSRRSRRLCALNSAPSCRKETCRPLSPARLILSRSETSLTTGGTTLRPNPP
jgi:hypothetical protein